MDNQQANRVAWLAGLIEGDGSIYFDKYNPRGYWKVTPEITITNKDYKLITQSSDILKENNIGCFIQQRKIKNGVVYDVKVKGYKRAKTALEVISTYLVGNKRTKAERMLNMINVRLSNTLNNPNVSYTEEEKQLFTEFKSLND